MAGFKYIGRRIFFLKENGIVILEIGEMKGWVVEPKKEFDEAIKEAQSSWTMFKGTLNIKDNAAFILDIQSFGAYTLKIHNIICIE